MKQLDRVKLAAGLFELFGHEEIAILTGRTTRAVRRWRQHGIISESVKDVVARALSHLADHGIHPGRRWLVYTQRRRRIIGVVISSESGAVHAGRRLLPPSARHVRLEAVPAGMLPPADG